MELFPLIDRAAALAPLGVLLYVLRRQDQERSRLLSAIESDRESFRNERRELLNRVQFPFAMPTGTRPTDRVDAGRVPPAAPVSQRVDERTLAERVREQWAQVGTVQAPHLPGDGDEVPA